MRKLAIIALVTGAIAMMGCQEPAPGKPGATPATGDDESRALSTPVWMRGEWTTEGADSTHSATTWFRLTVTATNIRTLSPTGGMSMEDTSSSNQIQVLGGENVTSTHYRVRLVVDGVQTLVLHFRRLNNGGMEYEANQDGVVFALRYLRKVV